MKKLCFLAGLFSESKFLTFQPHDTFKMYCCTLCLSKFNLRELAVFKLQAVEYAVSFRFYYCHYFLPPS